MRLIGFYDCSRNDLWHTRTHTRSVLLEIVILGKFTFNQLAQLSMAKKFKLILIRRPGKLLPMCNSNKVSYGADVQVGGGRGWQNFIIALHTQLFQLSSHLAPLVDSISLLGSAGNIFGNELLTIAIQFHTQFGQKCRRACCPGCRCHRK